MKNMYRVTRPPWAAKERAETWVILAASIILGIYGGWGERLAARLSTWFGVSPGEIHDTWPIVDVVVVTFGCLVIISIYKKLRIRCYPSTFIYCFNIPEASNPSGKSQVVGYCYIKPNMDNGEVNAEGGSFFWDNGRLDADDLVGFTSTLVRGIKDSEDTICHIRFDINKDDWPKRLYHHGILEFQPVPDPTSITHKDAYAGYLRSYRTDVELHDIEVSAKGYAEKYGKGCIAGKDIRAVLENNADMLLAKLNAVLNTVPQPIIWKAKDHMSSNKTNYFGHHIPKPQSVILNQKLRPYVNQYLSKVLALFGLDEPAIKRFQSLAIQAAKKEQDDTLVAYERDLKAGLIGLVVRRKEDEALTQRAKLIYSEITEYLAGDSLLDIGCGNGLISSLARSHFTDIQLLDVVEYVPKALNLPFLPYTDGHPLPTTESYDTVLLLTVLHHSNDPVELLKLAYRATRKRLIIIESVVGVHNVEPSVKYELVELSDESQIAYAAFVDWFYNRVLHDDVPVPYNFTTVDKWQSVFLQHNMRLARTIHLGQDIDIGPEYHVLFVIEKE